jgi:hypothetical protein
MYRSPVLKKAMELLYTTEPWKSAITFPWFKCLSRVISDYKTAPPIAFVAFVASAVSHLIFIAHITDPKFKYRSALDCLVTGIEETVPFSEHGYNDVFHDMYDLVEADSLHPEHGDIVRRNLQSLLADVRI